MKIINDKYGVALRDYESFYQWSIDNSARFWSEVWAYSGLIASTPANSVLTGEHLMPGARWFEGARLNFAENLLRFRDDEVALQVYTEYGRGEAITYRELYARVAAVNAFLLSCGVTAGDRVAACVSNSAEAVIAMLAVTSLGAIWSSCSPDFGSQGMLDRFSQIEPKLLFAVDGYRYGGKSISCREKITVVASSLPSLQGIVWISPFGDHARDDFPPLSVAQYGFPEVGGDNSKDISFAQLPFDAPLYILYSSGTTGLPKSIVHSAGGTLLQHLKELQLHVDLRRSDVIFYYTTCGWMMWNWLVSSLAVGATLVLYDGSPFSPNDLSLWRMAEDLSVTVFGTSAKYLATCQSKELRPSTEVNLRAMRALLSTGSPLVEEQYDYVYANIKADVQLSSISGGTDIVSCFALGCPIKPVYRGELQCRGLGMRVDAFDGTGQPIRGEPGELVCTAPFPSMPLGFWNDPGQKRFQASYFATFPGIWHHGDFVEITERGTVKILGRSDATLNPGGVRIGTAEIYRVVEQMGGVEDSLCLSIPKGSDEEVWLFVKLTPEAKWSELFEQRIKREIRTACTPRHVPHRVIVAPDIPYTVNGKKVELAARQATLKQHVKNLEALRNPESIEFFRSIL